MRMHLTIEEEYDDREKRLIGTKSFKYCAAGKFQGRKLSRLRTKREFCRENFNLRIALVQLSCRCCHKILRRKLSRMVLNCEGFPSQKFSAIYIYIYTVLVVGYSTNPRPLWQSLVTMRGIGGHDLSSHVRSRLTYAIGKGSVCW